MIQVPSPNYTAGRTQAISKVIIHWIVGNLASADSQFKNPASGVSAHYGVEDGTIHQYVAENNTAWHAKQANPFSIGIEHSAAPDRPASDATYDTTSTLIAQICKRYNLNPDTAIEPHNKYVATQCPGTMDLQRIKNSVKAKLGDDIVKPTEAQVYDAFRKWSAAGKPANPAQVVYYMGRDIRDMYRDLLIHEIQPKDPEIIQAFKDFQPWQPLNAPPYQNQSAYYAERPKGVMYKDLATGLKKKLDAATTPPPAKVDKAVVVEYIDKNLS